MATSTIFSTTAEKSASNNGVTLDQALTVDSNTTTTNTILENQHPSKSPIAKSIQLITYFGGNINNNQIAVEKYFIKPNFTGLISCIGPQNGIWYLPIPNSVYALKFYGPDEYNPQYYNMVYCVPAKQNNNYLTKYQDYTTAVPTDFITAFIKYVSTLPNNTEDKSSSAVPTTDKTKTFSSAGATQSASFSFNFWGNLSGVLGKASTFAFEFIYYPGQAPAQPTVE
jgi:hypothetical protein